MSGERRLAVLTTGRQDYGILRSAILALRDDPRFDVRVWAGGMHLSPAHGRTIERVRADVPVARELDFLHGDDVAVHAARATTLVADALREERPDALVLLGDRLETMAAAVAATLATVPIVHLHGGEETEGALDNALRHAITKLAHLHLVSHEAHARRVRQMGEDPERVVVVGAAGLDNLYRPDLPDRAALEGRLGMRLDPPVVLVTVHPATLGDVDEVGAVAAAMERVDARYVITQPNADAGGGPIRAFWTRWAVGRPVVLSDALGEQAYWGLLRLADAVLGNSSSGIIEAPAAGAPVVDVGDRQRGRLRPAHVEHAAARAGDVEQALRRALGRRAELAGIEPIYPSGPAAPRIVEALARWPIPHPPRKAFVDR